MMLVMSGVLENTIRHEAYLARRSGSETYSDHLVGLLDGYPPDHIEPCIRWGQIVHCERPQVLEAVVDLTGDCNAASQLQVMRECDIAQACGRAVFNGQVANDSICFWSCPTHAPLPSSDVVLPDWQKPIQRALGWMETWRLTLIEWWGAQKAKGSRHG